jgi:hypothetical protein
MPIRIVVKKHFEIVGGVKFKGINELTLNVAVKAKFANVVIQSNYPKKKMFKSDGISIGI